MSSEPGRRPKPIGTTTQIVLLVLFATALAVLAFAAASIVSFS
ncbi:hypothetical protein PRN20_17185 [Devosia sp. ZB163]|jgi:hypothetical protein|nr:hypothetical protein [Devosia sp. ZB163]MDC9825468.1 hypothetical protein [Devosia sp. ZB163]